MLDKAAHMVCVEAAISVQLQEPGRGGGAEYFFLFAHAGRKKESECDHQKGPFSSLLTRAFRRAVRGGAPGSSSLAHLPRCASETCLLLHDWQCSSGEGPKGYSRLDA